jgi:hypothetical protein
MRQVQKLYWMTVGIDLELQYECGSRIPGAGGVFGYHHTRDFHQILIGYGVVFGMPQHRWNANLACNWLQVNFSDYNRCFIMIGLNFVGQHFFLSMKLLGGPRPTAATQSAIELLHVEVLLPILKLDPRAQFRPPYCCRSL